MFLQVGYALALVRAYQTNDISVAYPLARGVAPLLISIGGVLFLSDSLPPLGFAGAAVATSGLVYIGLSSGKIRHLGWPLVTGGFIVAYTLVDASGVRRSGSSLPYVAALLFVVAVLFTMVVVAARPIPVLVASIRSLSTLGAGLMSGAAYAMVLVAVRLAPVGFVSTLRETSVILGVLGGWLVLDESMGPRRTAGAVIVLGGVTLLALSS